MQFEEAMQNAALITMFTDGEEVPSLAGLEMALLVPGYFAKQLKVKPIDRKAKPSK